MKRNNEKSNDFIRTFRLFGLSEMQGHAGELRRFKPRGKSNGIAGPLSRRLGIPPSERSGIEIHLAHGGCHSSLRT